MTNQSPTLPSQLIIVIITNHDKSNFVSDIGQNNTAMNFVTAIWQNSQNFHQKVATKQSTLLQLFGRMEVEQSIATLLSALSQLSGGTELIVADNWLHTVLEKLLRPCCVRYHKNGSLWTYILVVHVQKATSNQDLQRSITKSVWFARELW
jgi:hypothetical protein